MIYFVLALITVAGIGLYQTITQRRAHEQLEKDRREHYMRRLTA